MPADSVVNWARSLVEMRVAEADAARKKACKDPKSTECVHKLRTQVRRLRAALMDLEDCVPAAILAARARKLAGKTAKARDAAVLTERLQRYGRFSTALERAAIARVCKKLRTQERGAQKNAKRAMKDNELAGLLQ